MARAHVEFREVSKKFQRGELHDSLRDLVPALARRLAGRTPRSDELEGEEFWAVRDVSFTVRPGEALGIIGPNGAGKSTILKLLTGILRPNVGQREIRGRVGSLIEVAAGFHPDLTGRENVYLQGAIMGMTRAEIRRKFGEIVEFAELEDFIDTPVKRYSSGMNARLGFAIAVHLDPEVLIIDEVLAVGDFSFQTKAFGRIAEMARRDIPVVIVSHQLDRIAELCTHAILLDHGRVAHRGTPEECISQYVRGAVGGSGQETEEDLPLVLEALELRSEGPLSSGDALRLSLHGELVDDWPESWLLTITVRELETAKAIYSAPLWKGTDRPPRGPFRLDFELQANTGSGVFALEAGVWNVALRRQEMRGPQLIYQVVGDPGFFGSVNMHMRTGIPAAAGPHHKEDR